MLTATSRIACRTTPLLLNPHRLCCQSSNVTTVVTTDRKRNAFRRIQAHAADDVFLAQRFAALQIEATRPHYVVFNVGGNCHHALTLSIL